VCACVRDCVCEYVYMYMCIYMCVGERESANTYIHMYTHGLVTKNGSDVMGWLWLVGSLKLQVSFAKEPYKRDDILQETFHFKETTNRSCSVSLCVFCLYSVRDMYTFVCSYVYICVCTVNIQGQRHVYIFMFVCIYLYVHYNL